MKRNNIANKFQKRKRESRETKMMMRRKVANIRMNV
jgi:hypothetical protein